MDRAVKPPAMDSSALLSPATLIEGRIGARADSDPAEALRLLGELAKIAHESLVIHSFQHSAQGRSVNGPEKTKSAAAAPRATAPQPPAPPAFDASRFSTSRTEYKPALSNNHELIAALIEFHRANSPAAPSRAFGRAPVPAAPASGVGQSRLPSVPPAPEPAFAVPEIPAVDARPKPAPIPRRGAPGAYPVLRPSKKSPEIS